MTNEQLALLHKVREFVVSLPYDVLAARIDLSPGDVYTDDILPFELYKDTRQNIERIGDQINKSFYFGIYDGCAVLMRRLMEMLLILSFKEFKIDSEIRDPNGNYLQLSGIISRAVQNTTLDLSHNAKEYLDIFREKGNLSAHNPFHNALQADLERVQPKFRHLVQELFHKAGIL